MAPSPIPAPLPPWARALLQVAPFIQPALQNVLQYIHELLDGAQANPSEWRHIQILFELNGNIDPADVWVTTLDLINITGGNVDNSWTEADYDAVDAELIDLIAALLPAMPTNVKSKELRYYRRTFNPLSQTKPYPPSGPPERITALGFSGTAAGAFQVPQVAFTSTEKTPYPRHWGRNYWPAPSPTMITATGHFAASTIDTIGAAVQGAYLSLQQAEFFPVVPVTQIQGAPARALLVVNQVQVDDVPDVVRRRRPHSTTHRYEGP